MFVSIRNLNVLLLVFKVGKGFAVPSGVPEEVNMNWLNDMIFDLQRKMFGEKKSHSTYHAMWKNTNERDAEERLHQFQSRLQDLDKRILELR
jgi:hypothetical protein